MQWAAEAGTGYEGWSRRALVLAALMTSKMSNTHSIEHHLSSSSPSRWLTQRIDVFKFFVASAARRLKRAPFARLPHDRVRWSVAAIPVKAADNFWNCFCGIVLLPGSSRSVKGHIKIARPLGRRRSRMGTITSRVCRGRLCFRGRSVDLF